MRIAAVRAWPALPWIDMDRFYLGTYSPACHAVGGAFTDLVSRSPGPLLQLDSL